MKKLTLLFAAAAVIGLSGCEKITNSSKNIASDWIGLDRTITYYGCLTGKEIRSYSGDVRINEEDGSLLVDGKKLNHSSRSCFIMHEKGLLSDEEKAALPKKK